jgi:hypothetical protein
MLRTQLLRSVGGYQDNGWPEDYDLILRLHARGARMRNLPDVLLDWRERADRASRTDARYSLPAFHRCKAFYLAASMPCGQDSAIVWGAGPVGKSFARDIAAQGIRIAGFVDVDPRKIGQHVGRVPIFAPDELLARRGRSLVISAVSGAPARARIRGFLADHGLQECRDFIAVA